MRVAVLLALVAACGGSSNPATDGPGGDDDDAPPIGDGPPPDIEVPLDPCDPGMWCTETSPVNALLHAVWVIDLNNVIAVGAGGVILQRRDNAWTQMTSGTTEDLDGVWASGPTDVWAVGANGTILRYDGATWSPFGTFTKDFRAVWGAGVDDVFLLGVGGVEHFTGGTTFEFQQLTGVPAAISGTSSTNVWVTGETTKVAHYNGTWTTGIDPGDGATYFSIAAIANDVWISTFKTRRLEGATWVDHSPTPTTVFSGIYPITTTDIWSAGGSRTGHWDGATWTTEIQAAGAASLFGIHGSGPSLWVVGQNGMILHRR